MFSGIIEEIGKIAAIGGDSVSVKAEKIFEELKPGDSVAINGICLTVVSIKDKVFSVNVMPETLRRSNLGGLHSGDPVNLERALTLSGRIGGHFVQGHIDAVGSISRLTDEGDARLMTIRAPQEVMKYIVEKGFVAVDGLSLTVMKRSDSEFTVSLVQFSRSHTTMEQKKPGDHVNLEADIIGKYVESFSSLKTRGISEDFLNEHGFLS